MEGNKRFVENKAINPHHDITRLKKLVEGQQPFAVVLACSDSRVAVEALFDQGFGDIFVCRVAGNIATTEEIASVEYAVAHLGSKAIVVMGHSGCGAIGAALSRCAHPGFVDALVNNMEVAINQSLNENKFDNPDDVSKINAIVQANRIQRSSLISQAIREGKVEVRPAFFNIANGEVEFLNYQDKLGDRPPANCK